MSYLSPGQAQRAKGATACFTKSLGTKISMECHTQSNSTRFGKWWIWQATLKLKNNTKKPLRHVFLVSTTESTNSHLSPGNKVLSVLVSGISPKDHPPLLPLLRMGTKLPPQKSYLLPEAVYHLVSGWPRGMKAQIHIFNYGGIDGLCWDPS